MTAGQLAITLALGLVMLWGAAIALVAYRRLRGWPGGRSGASWLWVATFVLTAVGLWAVVLAERADADTTTSRPGYVTTTTDLDTSTSWSTTTTEGATLIPPVTVTRPAGGGAAGADWLSRTGSSTGRLALAGIGLVVAATGVLLAARRRRRKATS